MIKDNHRVVLGIATPSASIASWRGLRYQTPHAAVIEVKIDPIDQREAV